MCVSLSLGSLTKFWKSSYLNLQTFRRSCCHLLYRPKILTKMQLFAGALFVASITGEERARIYGIT